MDGKRLESLLEFERVKNNPCTQRKLKQYTKLINTKCTAVSVSFISTVLKTFSGAVSVAKLVSTTDAAVLGDVAALPELAWHGVDPRIFLSIMSPL